MLPTITPSKIDIPPGGTVILKAQTWDDYETVLATRQDQASLKISFSASTQEIRIMSPLPKHANNSAILVDLVKALLRFYGLDWHDFDPVTLKKLQQKGLEPDHCFYIQNYASILGRDRIDLDRDPPPDLALEVDLTSFSSIDDYEAIAIPELWIYRDRTLKIYVMEEGHYQAVNHSRLFPDIPLSEIIPTYIERAWTVGSSVVLREFERYLKEQPLKDQAQDQRG